MTSTSSTGHTTKSMQDYLDGLMAKSESPIIHISDLDDSFTRTVSGLFPGKTTEFAGLASILELLISFKDGRSIGMQSEASIRVLTSLLEAGLLDLLISSILPGSDSIVSCLVSLVKFAKPAPDKMDRLIEELAKLKPEAFEKGYSLHSLLMAALDFKSLLTKNEPTLSEKSIDKLASSIKGLSMKNCSLIHLMWAIYTGMLACIDEKLYEKSHQVYINEAQQSIESGSFDHLGIFMDPKSNPNAHLNRNEDALYMVMSFLSLFETEKTPEFSILCHDIYEILEGSPELCEKFWEHETSTKPLMDHLLSLFPSSCYDIIPLFRALCQTESSARKVYNLLERIENLTLMSPPDSSFVSKIEDGSLIAARNLDAAFARVQVVIPEETTCKVDGEFYRWNLQYSGWDYLARHFSANEHAETANLFARLYTVLPQAKQDTESFLERINALYLEPRGSSFYTRLTQPLSKKRIDPNLFEAIAEGLALFDNAGEEESRLLLFQSSQVEGLVKELYVHEPALGSVGALLTLSLAWLPSCSDPEPILNNILSMVSRFVTKPELSHEMKSTVALKLAKLIERVDVPKDLEALANEFTWNCIDCALKEDRFDKVVLQLITLDSVWETHRNQLFSLLKNDFDGFLVKSMGSESLFLGFLTFLSKWSQRIPEAFPFQDSSVTLLCHSLDSLPTRSAVAEFIFSLKPVNIKLMQSIVAIKEGFISHLIRDTAKDLRCGELYVEYTWNLVRSTEFVALSKVFPGSPKVLWDTLMAYVDEAIRMENFTIVSMSLELLAHCLILTSKDYDIAYLSLITSKMLNDLCKHALGDDQLLQFFARFVMSCACSPPLREHLLHSLSTYLAKHADVSLGTLTTIADGLSLCKDYDKYFEQLLVQIYQKFEAISADGLYLFSGESVFVSWCNLLLFSTQQDIPKDARVGINVLVRLICSHIAMKPSEEAPKCLLLLARLFSHPELGPPAFQFCSFYHLNEHVVRCLLNTDQAQSLLPTFLLNEEFARLFVSSGSLTVLLNGSHNNTSLWDSLFVLARNPDLHPHLLHHLQVADIISHSHVGKLLDLLAVVVPAKIDMLERPELVCYSLIDICWTILVEPRTTVHEAELALNIISLVLLQLNKGPLADDLYQCSRRNLGILENLKVSSAGQELILALRDLLE